ncbi:hypothetical protein ACQPZX_34245 [Actinoplanes sp. CA-142083]|uniref:hypothetical protein n=1 Tax=Actinoplanes sp. CA-142083 TaxID=3239903 RepID=UPI003D8D4582
MRPLFVALVVVTLLTALDATIVATALPSIVADLGGERHMAWVLQDAMPAAVVGTATAAVTLLLLALLASLLLPDHRLSATREPLEVSS